MSTRTMYAVFIGIDAYTQSPLSGCIKDVLDMDLLLSEQLAQQPDIEYKPVYFLAPNKLDLLRIRDYETQKKIKLEYKAPTFKTITEEAFPYLKTAKDNDICFLYYSGHGSQIEAPPEFWHSKPDRQNETIVCVDSRDPRNPAARDIIDKELAFLLWDALNGKELHCLVIMDCCHSGNNTRAAAKVTDIKFRYETPSDKKIPLEKYLGYDKGFYKKNKDGQASIEIARYVHLAAARDSEKAQESGDGGLFTSKLTEVLRSGGTAKSYREIVQGLNITVSNRVSQQNPVAYAREDKDLDLQFLGKGVKPYEPSYEVRYDFKAKKWIMYGGAMHNISPSSGGSKTTVRVNGSVDEIEVMEVSAFTSVLDAVAMDPFDKEKEDYQAIIARMANPGFIVTLSPQLMPKQVAAIKEAYKNSKHLFFSIDLTKKPVASDYIIQSTTDKAYILTKPGSDIPLFKREQNAARFLSNVDVVSKWISVSELKSNKTGFSKDDFIFRLEKIEGKKFTAETIAEWEQYEADVSELSPGTETVFSYRGDDQPAFRLSIAIKNETLGSCYIGALYMESRFGIIHNLIEPDKGRLVKGGSPIDLSWTYAGKEYTTIVLSFNPRYRDYNITEITEFLKIFVSTKPLNLERYKQDNLELDEIIIAARNRELALDTDRASGTAEEVADWTVFTFPFRIVGSNKEQRLEAGKPAAFSSFEIQAPKDFNATAFAATGNDLQEKLRFGARAADGLAQYISPPENIWGDTELAEAAFSNGLSPSSDNGIQVLELSPDEGSELILKEGDEIIITPKKTATRDITETGLEETIVPFGYDEATQLYFPIGFSDATGVIHIQKLPAATPGLIKGDQKLNRSIGGSIKLFFKKIFQSKKLNTLKLYQLEPGKPWKMLTDDPANMQTILNQHKNANIVLLMHGIFGDMKSITGSLMQVPEFSSVVQFVLAYDYENLSTSIEKTAKSLYDDLATAGFGAGNGIKLSIIAHSMGGLVSRWLVEQEAASAYVQQLIFAGTPNGGSEMAHLKSSVLGLLTHAMNVTGPVKFVITGLSFLLKKIELDPGKTLNEMDPGSAVLQKLALSDTPANVRYSIIGGDTSLLKSGYNGEDYFLKKVAEMLQTGVVYPSLTFALFNKKINDMAVTIDSMRSIPQFDTGRMYVFASDHLTYFTEPSCRKKMLELLAGKT